MLGGFWLFKINIFKETSNKTSLAICAIAQQTSSGEGILCFACPERSSLMKLELLLLV